MLRLWTRFFRSSGNKKAVYHPALREIRASNRASRILGRTSPMWIRRVISVTRFGLSRGWTTIMDVVLLLAVLAMVVCTVSSCYRALRLVVGQ